MDNKKIKILVVDDDLEICKLLCQYLEQQGFAVASVDCGVALDEYLSQSNVDLIILDLMLPGEDGLSIVKRLNSSSQIPIIMLSACGEDIDRIIGLEIGADDYLAKPFNPRELLARIRSVLRRKQGEKPKTAVENNEIYSFGEYVFNTNNQSLICDGKKITLTSGEYSLLKIFVESPKQVLSRDDLLEKLKGYDCAPFDRSVDVRIMRLRQKIEVDTSMPLYIQTVWGKGYQFIPND